MTLLYLYIYITSVTRYNNKYMFSFFPHLYNNSMQLQHICCSSMGFQNPFCCNACSHTFFFISIKFIFSSSRACSSFYSTSLTILLADITFLVSLQHIPCNKTAPQQHRLSFPRLKSQFLTTEATSACREFV